MASRATSFGVRLARDLWQKLGWRLGLFLVLAVLGGLTDGIAMALLFPLVGALGIGGAENNAVSAAAARLFAFLGMPNSLLSVGAVLIVAFVLQSALALAAGWLAAALSADYVVAWRLSLLRRLMDAGWPFYLNKRAGELQSRLFNDCQWLGLAFFTATQMLSTALVAVIYVVLALLASWQITLALTAIALVIIGLTHPIIRRGENLGNRITAKNAEFNSLSNEIFNGMKAVKATASEDFVTGQFSELFGALRKLYFWTNFNVSLLKASFETVSIIALVAMLIVTVEYFHVDFSTIMVVLALFVRLYPRIGTFQQNLQSTVFYTGSLRALDAAVEESAAAQEQDPGHDVPARVLREGQNLVLRDVIAGYGGTPVLDGLTLEIPAGATVGIVGASGAGKTTLLDCLLRLIVPSAGAVLVDGEPLQALSLRNWRRSVGYVAQDTVLFNASIRDNIAWGNDDYDETAIIEAARRAHAHGFIMETAQGYETVIGDRGVRLSGGQRQRLGLARALLGRKSLLILDEATSALDSDAEAKVMEAVRALHGSLTIIIVAHRLSTVRYADRIHVLDAGRVIESGTWAELLAHDGAFARLWAMQSDHPAP